MNLFFPNLFFCNFTCIISNSSARILFVFWVFVRFFSSSKIIQWQIISSYIQCLFVKHTLLNANLINKIEKTFGEQKWRKLYQKSIFNIKFWQFYLQKENQKAMKIKGIKRKTLLWENWEYEKLFHYVKLNYNIAKEYAS